MMIPGSWIGEEAAAHRASMLYREQDSYRNGFLDWLVKIKGKCEYCGATVTDRLLVITPGVCGANKCKRKRRKDDRMAVAAEGNPQAVNYVYVIGGEDYVFREIKRRLLKLSVNVSGHASIRWKAPPDVPKVTTHILIVSDNINKMLLDAGENAGKALKIPVIHAPAREQWDTTLALLKKFGLFDDSIATQVDIQIVAAKPPQPSQSAPHTGHATIGEALSAKGKELPKLEEKAQIKVEEKAPAPPTTPPPAAPVAPVVEPTPIAANGKDEPVYTHANRARQILTETKGVLSNKDIAEIISKESKMKCSDNFVLEMRHKLKLPEGKRGKKSKEAYALIAKYTKEKAVAPIIHAPTQVVKTAPPPPSKAPVDMPKPKETQKAPVQAREPYSVVKDSAPPDLTTAFNTTDGLDTIENDIIKPFNVGRLVLVWENGEWQEPDVEFMVVTKAKVKLKKRG